MCREGFDLLFSAEALDTDARAYVPPAGRPFRDGMVSRLQTLSDTALRQPRIGATLKELTADAAFMGRVHPTEAALLRGMLRVFNRRTAVPSSLVAQLNKAVSDASYPYEVAKGRGDFGIFQPHLEAIVPLVCEKAERLAKAEGHGDLYGTLMSELEPGMTTERLKAIIATIKPRLIALVKAIAKSGVKRPTAIERGAPYDLGLQYRLSERMMEFLGYDRARGARLATVVHPFTNRIGPFDTRITTHFLEEDLLPGTKGTAHEIGHALHDQGMDDALQQIPSDVYGTSFGLHESQSRTTENLVCLNPAVWVFFYPIVQEIFPHFLDVPFEEFMLILNWVERSHVRTEADEVTYNFHIMLRAEIEMDLIHKKIRVADLPDVWEEASMKYLGIVPPNDTLGVLQDVHWSRGLFGYFPSYMLGNLYGPIIFKAMLEQVPYAMENIAMGNFAPVHEWYRKNVHRHGFVHSAEEVIRSITGREADITVALDRLEAKYGRLYGLPGFSKGGGYLGA